MEWGHSFIHYRGSFLSCPAHHVSAASSGSGATPEASASTSSWSSSSRWMRRSASVVVIRGRDTRERRAESRCG